MRSTGKQSIAMPRIALQPLIVRNCLKGQEVIESRASHAFFVKNNGSNKMNVSEWAGRTDFSDFSLGQMDRLGNLFGAAARHHQTNQRNHQCELLAPLDKKRTKRISDHRFNSPQFNFLVGAFFNPLNWEKKICKSRARQIRSMSSRIRVFQLKNGFQPPRFTSQFVLNSQATCFSKC